MSVERDSEKESRELDDVHEQALVHATATTVPAALAVALVAVQVTLGALTVLSRRAVWINSAHVVCGASVLATSLVITLRSWRVKFAAPRVQSGGTAGGTVGDKIVSPRLVEPGTAAASRARA